MRRKRWLGQFKREWQVMKPNLLIYAVLNLLIVIGGSFFTHRIFTDSPQWFDHVLIIGGFWFVIGMFVGVGVMLKSLEGEMKNPYVWLHSPATMLELISVKVVFATFMTTLLLIWSEFIIVVLFFSSTATLPVPYGEAFYILLVVLIAFILNSIFITASGFFFWSIYRILHTRTSVFGFAITFGLFGVVMYCWEKIRMLGFFEALEKIWPLRLIDEALYEEPSKYFFVSVVADGPIVSVGSFLFYMILSLLLIWSGALLFEKKARL